MSTHPKFMCLALDPKLTYSTHIHNILVQAHKPLQIKQKDTLMATYKAVMRPALEYASSIWSPLASSTIINKLHVRQYTALRTAIGCTQDTNMHLHDETLILTIDEHLQLHASSITPLTQTYKILQQSKLKTLSLTTAAIQQTFPQTPTQSLQHT